MRPGVYFKLCSHVNIDFMTFKTRVRRTTDRDLYLYNSQDKSHGCLFHHFGSLIHFDSLLTVESL